MVSAIAQGNKKSGAQNDRIHHNDINHRNDRIRHNDRNAQKDGNLPSSRGLPRDLAPPAPTKSVDLPCKIMENKAPLYGGVSRATCGG